MNGCSGNGTEPGVTSTTTTVDYVFAEFLTDPRPDVIILVANMHDSFRLSSSFVIERQLKRIDQYVANSTRVVIVSLHAPNLARMPWTWRYKIYQDRSGKPVDRAEWARQFNRLLYRQARDRFISGGKLLLMPDLFEATPLELNYDGVHMKPVWYEYVVSAITQYLCDM